MKKRQRFDTSTDFQFFKGDAARILKLLPDNYFSLIVTSPPYNIGKNYETNNIQSLNDYIEWLDNIIGLSIDKLANTGSICWQTGNYVNKGEIFPLDIYLYHLFKKRGLQLRNRIIWQFNFGLHSQKRLSGRYETILWFTKSSDYKFNLDPIRVPQIYPGKRHSSTKGDLAGKPSGNPHGKNPTDFWEFSFNELFEHDTVWNIPNVKANHPEKTIHPCQFPTELVERCVLAFTEKGDSVLDPFVGTGTSVIAALKHDRRGVGIDKSREYLDIAQRRVHAFRDGTLKLRPIGKPIRGPQPTEKVAMLPDEWVS